MNTFIFRCTKCNTDRSYGHALLAAPIGTSALLECDAKCGKGEVPKQPNLTRHEYNRAIPTKR